MTRRIAFLTMDSLEDFVADDALAEAPLTECGVAVDWVSWRADGVDWSAYEAVVIRTPWDYQDAPEAFLARLGEIETHTRLANPAAACRWNLRKRYLRDLEAGGVRIVPTRWHGAWDAVAVREAFAAFDGDELIVKPEVSANADRTYRLRLETPRAVWDDLAEAFASRAHLVQPFLPTVLAEGEFSLFYFGGAYSHAILKTPKPGDFRVQEEHGGLIQRIEPEPALRAAADATLAALAAVPSLTNEPLLYARPDFVRTSEGFALMELELIEPALYFRMDAPYAATRFAEAVVKWLDQRSA